MFQRIIVPVDGSDASNLALDAALRIAREREGPGQVKLVHVVEEMAYLSGGSAYGAYSADMLGIMRDAGNTILADALARAQASGVSAETQLYDKLGDRLSEVVGDLAQSWRADLVVVGTHGRRGMRRLLLGSGAEQIIRTAPVPVLVIRSPDRPAP
jgi:nucleotide-binding universal stress UspA family protein